MSTALELLAIVTATLNDAAYTRWPKAELLGYMNEAQRDIARRTGLFRTVATLAVDATQTPATAFYTMPADMLELKRLTLDGDQLHRTTLEALGDRAEDVTGRASEYLYGDYGPTLLRLYPYPTTATTGLKAYFVRRPATLALDADVPEVPEDYQMALPYYAIARAYLKDFEAKDPAKGEAFRQMYENEVANLARVAARQFDASPRTARADYV